VTRTLVRLHLRVGILGHFVMLFGLRLPTIKRPAGTVNIRHFDIWLSEDFDVAV
jgi:hypothetical protein